ncbi:hypothetical protein ACFL5P_04570 [candidate division KSB1 bacterium]
MITSTVTTWILVIFGAVTILPLAIAQLSFLFQPKSRKAKDILIGKDEEWRNNTHFRSAYGLAWADWILLVPLVLAGSIGVILGYVWGYVLWASSGIISVYVNIVLWIMEKEYVYPSLGPLKYYTYYWGFFIYWGIAAAVYSVLRLSNIQF